MCLPTYHFRYYIYISIFHFITHKLTNKITSALNSFISIILIDINKKRDEMNERKSENNINDECVGPPLFMYDRCSRAVVLFTYMWYACVCVCVWVLGWNTTKGLFQQTHSIPSNSLNKECINKTKRNTIESCNMSIQPL